MDNNELKRICADPQTWINVFNPPEQEWYDEVGDAVNVRLFSET